MFTGLIEEVGIIKRLEPLAGGGARLWVQAPRLVPSLQVGESLALNGTCLTVAFREEDQAGFEVVLETLRRTNLGDLREGSRVNLERPLTPESRIGGHFVQGHIETTALIDSIEPQGNAHVFRYRLQDRSAMRYIVPKGSIAVDGVSLTVVEVGEDWFTVWIIPFTWEHTNFSARQVGERVNIETDILARYVERCLKSYGLSNAPYQGEAT